MAVQQIKLRVQYREFIPHPHIGHAGIKFCCIDTLLGKETAAMLAEVVVHGGVEDITVQPMLGSFPHLTNQDTLRLFFFHRLPKCPPESVVDLAGNIQTPAVNSKFPHPIAAHLAEILLYFRVAGVGFRHHALIAEAFIGRIGFWVFRPLYRELQMVKPVFIF